MIKFRQIIKILKLFFFIFLSAICIASLYLYIDSATYLDIETFVITQGKFNISKSKYIYPFKTKFSEKYNLILTIFDDKDYETILNMVKRINIIVDVNLKDDSGNIIRNELISQKNLECCHYFGESFSFCLLTFDSVKNKKYSIQVDFDIGDNYFDKKFKKLIIRKDYDPEAIFWARDFKKIFFIIFCISLFLIIVMILYYIRKKRKGDRPVG